ncbi:hypothetical protein MRY82_09780 [bacterium]|nr:hypothetical protein [bacterium]
MSAQTSHKIIVLDSNNPDQAQLAQKFKNINMGYTAGLNELFDLKKDQIFKKTVGSWEIKSSKAKECGNNEKYGRVCWEHFVLTLGDQQSDKSHDFAIQVLDNRSNGSLSISFEPKALDYFCSKVISDYVLVGQSRYLHLIYNAKLYNKEV